MCLNNADLFSDTDQLGKKRPHHPPTKKTTKKARLASTSSSSSSTSSSSDSEPEMKKKKSPKTILVTFTITCRSIRLEGQRTKTDHKTSFTTNTDPDFHISSAFYPSNIQMAKDSLSALPYFKDLSNQERTWSYRDIAITYQTEADKWHTIPYPLTAFFRQTAMDPLITNNSANLKLSFDIVVADAPKPAPSPNMVSNFELEALNSLRDIARIHHDRPPHIIMDRLSSMFWVYMQQLPPTSTTTRPTPSTSSSSTSGYSSSKRPSKYDSSPWNRLDRR